ncbi:hypothetical protein QQX98_008307 [Neonectria punicea]|uniref:beta-glucosidase n=1 Tax=Neonectria punicea TaxID=979145 RepID=A0ABR1GWP3_9HYPO
MAGSTTWRTPPVDRLGIPQMKVSDGPSGARGEIFGESTPAAFFPSGVSLGATWDEELMYEVGVHLAEETKSRSASVILAPTMCIHRHPLGGRNFESFSEDPFLTGKLAAAHIRGVQSRGIAATPKHLLEYNRFHYSAQITTRALREVYLLPFQMVVCDADPWCIMTSYNKVNGSYCDMSKLLMTDIARGEWGWKGVFPSDWGGTHSTFESINAGLDIEFPGPPEKRSKAALEGPLRNGLVDLNAVDASATRVLRLLQKVGRFTDRRDEDEYVRDDPETKALLLRTASSGIAMLKNENGALPLRPNSSVKKIAVVSPNAKRVIAGGGGSSYIKAPYWTNVFDSVAKRFQEHGTEVSFATGAKVNRYLPTIPPDVVRNADTGVSGAAVDWYLGHDLSSSVVATTHIDDLYYMTFGTLPPGIDTESNFSYRVRAILKPLTSGRHDLSFASIGPSTLFIDGKKVLAQSGDFEKKGTLFFTYGSDEKFLSLDLEAGGDYRLEVEYHSHDRQLREDLVGRMDPMEDKFQGFRIGYEEPGASTSDLSSEAAALARDADAAIVVVGRDKEWETEGQDIPTFELPGQQVQLIQQVAAVNKRTIVLDPWIDDVEAVLFAWYQGQELGNAAAAVLAGEFNPCGRLPVTFPRRIEDCPAFSSYPGELGEILYSEDLFVGYKWWHRLGIKPHFPLGFGLSYNKFEVASGSITSSTISEGTTLIASVSVKNTGGSDIPGRETVLAFHSQSSPKRLARPNAQVCGFSKSPLLAPGEQAIVEIRIEAKSFGVFDPSKGLWIMDANTKFDILLGTNAENAVPAWQVEAPEEITWKL